MRTFLNLEDWIALPEIREFHVEAVEGVLLLAPRPLPMHQRAVIRLTNWIEQQVPEKYCAVHQSEMVVAEVMSGWSSKWCRRGPAGPIAS